MKDNLDFEIKKRLESDIWDQKIYQSVLKKTKKENRVFLFKLAAAIILFTTVSINSLFYYQSYKLKQNEQIISDWAELIDNDLDNKTFSDVILASF